MPEPSIAAAETTPSRAVVVSDAYSASVADVCCGSRMFWFDRKDPRAVFVDKRREHHTLPDKSSAGGSRELVIDPDLQADFTALPFEDESFSLVVFDPPHLIRNGKKGWLAKKYGKKRCGSLSLFESDTTMQMGS